MRQHDQRLITQTPRLPDLRFAGLACGVFRNHRLKTFGLAFNG
jgi:hypothetical protein